MSGKGKAGYGKSGGKAPRQSVRHVHRPVVGAVGPSKSGIRRLARRGGVVRISGMVYDQVFRREGGEVKGALGDFLNTVIRDAVTYTVYAKRKTVTAMDIVYGLRRQGIALYGFGS